MRVDMATLLRIRKSQSPVTFGVLIFEGRPTLERPGNFGVGEFFTLGIDFFFFFQELTFVLLFIISQSRLGKDKQGRAISASCSKEERQFEKYWCINVDTPKQIKCGRNTKTVNTQFHFCRIVVKHRLSLTMILFTTFFFFFFMMEQKPYAFSINYVPNFVFLSLPRLVVWSPVLS